MLKAHLALVVLAVVATAAAHHGHEHKPEEVKKIVVFGATGTIGKKVLEAAVKKGLEVRAFVRDPAKVPEDIKDKVEIVQGDILDKEAVDKAVDGVDAVVDALGPKVYKGTTLMTNGAKNIVEAMKKHNVKIVSVCLSGFQLFTRDVYPEMFYDITDDHNGALEVFKKSGLNTVPIFFSYFADLPSGDLLVNLNPVIPVPKIVLTDYQNPEKTVTWDPTGDKQVKVSKTDVGRFLVEVLEKPEFYKKTLAVASWPQP